MRYIYRDMKSDNTPEKKEVANVDLKLKITNIFSKLRPENRTGFIEKMNKFDELSTISKILQEQIGGNPDTPPKPIVPPILVPISNAEASELPDASPNSSPRSIASEASDSILSFLGDEGVEKLQEANKKFMEEQHDEFEEGQIVENITLPESRTIYRDDEIVSELIDYFRDSDKSTVFSNDEKLKIWVDDLMGLVKTTSEIRDETEIIGAKTIDQESKPIVDNYKEGNGSGVNWLITLSNEKKKLYNAGDDTDEFHYSIEKEKEQEAIEEAETKFFGFDHQQKLLNELNKTYNNDDECLHNANQSRLLEDKEVYTITSIENVGDKINYKLDKRVLDDSVVRLYNDKKSRTIKSKAASAKDKEKKEIAYGKKQITGVKEEIIVDRPIICSRGFVTKTPGSTIEKRQNALYVKVDMKVTETDIANSKKLASIVPFRQTNQKYIVIEDFVNTKDPLHLLNSEISPLIIDDRSIPISKVDIGDKVILSFTYPYINQLEPSLEQPILPNQSKFNPDINNSDIELQQIPITIKLLVRVVGKDVSIFNPSDNQYYFKDGTSSLVPDCKLEVIPMMSNRSIVNRNWENESITVNSPNIINRFKCNCDLLKVNDTASIVMTRLQMDKYINKQEIESIPRKNPNFIGDLLTVGGKELNYLLSHDSTNVFKIQVLNKTDTNIHFKILEVITGDNISAKKGEVIMTLNEFKEIYISMYESAESILESCVESLEKFDIYSKSKVRDRIEKVYYTGTFRDAVRQPRINPTIKNKIDVWCKVLACYSNVSNRDLDRRSENLYLVQILQSTYDKKLGDYLLVPSSQIKYEVNKTVFEKDLLGDSSILKWINGVFIDGKIDELVPTALEFLNKITNKLSVRDNISYGFIADLLNLALRFDKHQISTTVRERINYWIHWNLVNHVEKNAKQLMKLRENYLNLHKLFSTSDELNPEKYRLIRDIDENLLVNYKDWKVTSETYSYDRYKNKQLVDLLQSTLGQNKTLWTKLDKDRLTKYQKERIINQKKPMEKKWDKVLVAKSGVKTKEMKVLDAIYAINEPILRNNILIDFIEKNCYLSKDNSGNDWYFSKIDTSRTPLICPHIYLEITGKSVKKYERAPEEGVVVCNNCGQVLNSLVFSYFEGYGDNAAIREEVKIVNGKEVIGTMEDTEIVTLEEHVFDKLTNNHEYELEVQFNNLVKSINSNSEIFKFFNTTEGIEAKTSLIYLARAYMGDNSIAPQFYDKWAKLQEPLFKQRNITNLTVKQEMFKNYLSSRKEQILIAIIFILFEKKLPIEFKLDNSIVLEKYLISGTEAEIKKKSTYSKNITNDYNKLILYPSVEELYKASESKHESEGTKLAYEDKFKDYTASNIDSSLTLFDAYMWLRYTIRSIHKEQTEKPIIAIAETTNCAKEGAQTYTESSNLELINALEHFIESKLPSDENRTGVKSRVQVVAKKEYIIPDVSVQKGLEIEASYIAKNLFASTSAAIIGNILRDIQKYRYIDYLVAYTIDKSTGKVVPRIFENGFDEETNLTRDKLITTRILDSEVELKKMFDELKSKEITLEVPKVLEDDCDELEMATTTDNIYTMMNRYLIELLSEDEDEALRTEIPNFISILKSIEKEFTIDASGEKIYSINSISESDPKKRDEIRKTIILKEYEKLSKILSYLKRDYNYIANKADLISRKQKLAEKMEMNLGSNPDYENAFTTDYDYLIKFFRNFTSLDKLVEFQDSLHKLQSNDCKLIETAYCEKGDEITQLINRNNKNKYIICATILKLLLQYKYEWDTLDYTNVEFRNVDINIEADVDLTYRKDVAKLLIEFVKNLNNIFMRETKVLENINQYKEQTFELSQTIERSRRMKFAEAIGIDLMKEFNKVNKGKKKLDIRVGEDSLASSDAPLEKVTRQRLDRYNAEDNGDYGKITRNVVEGDYEREDGNEYEAFDATE